MRKPIVPNVSPEELVPESIYFMLTFFDGDLLIPDVETVVYLGRDIFEEGDETHYFESFQQYSDKKNNAADDEHEVIGADDRLLNFYTAAGVAEVFARLAAR